MPRLPLLPSWMRFPSNLLSMKAAQGSLGLSIECCPARFISHCAARFIGCCAAKIHRLLRWEIHQSLRWENHRLLCCAAIAIKHYALKTIRCCGPSTIGCCAASRRTIGRCAANEASIVGCAVFLFGDWYTTGRHHVRTPTRPRIFIFMVSFLCFVLFSPLYSPNFSCLINFSGLYVFDDMSYSD